MPVASGAAPIRGGGSEAPFLDELEPNVTTVDVEVREDRGLLTWPLTFVTADEPWQHGLGECQLLVEVTGDRRLRGRAVLIRSDLGRWHYFQGAGELEGLDASEFDFLG